MIIKIVTKIWNVFTNILVGLVILLAVLLAGVRLAGLQVFTVLSGSMEPAYPTGALIYVRDVDYRQLEVGDVITFQLNEGIVATHRIVEVVTDEMDPSVIRYRTKGDANNVEDGALVPSEKVLGSPVFSIPYLGYLANYIQSPPGIYIAAATGAGLMLLVFLPDYFSGNESDEGNAKKRKSSSGGRYLR